MSDAIQLLLEVNVPKENKAALEALATEMVAVAAAEPGTLLYEWCFDESGECCHITELYQNSAAGDVHVQGFVDNYAEKFFALCSCTSINVYGEPSDFVKSVLEGLSPNNFSRAFGINRMLSKTPA